ncbi:hypothetical protein MC7420_4325 [Coleofasciculus chthonoplastes PCC 7420]|uniref:Uncharacterized protein n=1 Tax=Coleofasciculus chthonoplastes PCC 7420 TaxID=118168 RepID=B4W3U6_9CYAN|nr:hypothetical protein [Coleofasciculus chthonoplastes]EDX71138.1 hypothetical protein MC7420_4325 [Coleofasciculus chthonoplastes PCC 7420]
MRKRSQNLRDGSGCGDSSVVSHLRSAKECDRPSDFLHKSEIERQ